LKVDDPHSRFLRFTPRLDLHLAPDLNFAVRRGTSFAACLFIRASCGAWSLLFSTCLCNAPRSSNLDPVILWLIPCVYVTFFLGVDRNLGRVSAAPNAATSRADALSGTRPK
jgi:hypothetical protein